MLVCNPVRSAERYLARLRRGIMAKAQVSERVLATDEPCIVKTKQMMEGVAGVVSLAQGVVHWAPPQSALDAARDAAGSAAAHAYGPAQGSPVLRAALRDKVAAENGLHNVDIMVTAGANQAFVNVLLSLTDAADRVVLFRPYYFNHLMAVQMTGGARAVSFGEPTSDLKPDLDWLEAELAGEKPPKMVVIVNPCNPAGFLLSKEEVQRAQAMCESTGAWLVLDNTYEHFTYGADEHSCTAAPNVVNIFSFSKAYGMMGWRVGYIAYPDDSQCAGLGAEILKVQDTIPICPSQVSQVVAHAALGEGRGWVRERVAGLQENRQLAVDALSVLGSENLVGDAAIYLFAKLPDGLDDTVVVERLIKEHKVTTIPGSSCGSPGYIRVAYANCTTEECAEACERLKTGLQALISEL